MPAAAFATGASVIEFPDLVQSIGNGRRTGMLTVRGPNHRRRLLFRNGEIIAGDTGQKSQCFRGLRWLRLALPMSYKKAGVAQPDQLEDVALAQAVIAKQITSEDGIRDAVDCLIEELICEVVAWKQASFDFQEQVKITPWMKYQVDLGTRLGAAGLLMEALRRQDEINSLGVQLPRDWDALMQEQDPWQPKNIEEKIFKQTWRQGRPVLGLMKLAPMPPSVARRTLAELLIRKVYRVARANELAVFAEHEFKAGHRLAAEGLYNRATEIGAQAPRVYLQLGQLRAETGRPQEAAQDYFAAADLLLVSDADQALQAAEKALELDDESLELRQRMVAMYRKTERTASAIDVLFDIARRYESLDDAAGAQRAVREARELGADPMHCAQTLASFALLSDDTEGALQQLELVAKHAKEKRDFEAMFTARRQMLLIAPGRGVIALAHAQALETMGEVDDAVGFLQAALVDEQRDFGADVETDMRALLAEWAPDDTENLQALSALYRDQENATGAGQQLELKAQAQARDEDISGLVETLRELCELLPGRLDHRAWLAGSLAHIGRDREAKETFATAVEQAVANQDDQFGQEVIDKALTLYPEDHRLHRAAATVAERANDRSAAERHWRHSAALAEVAGDAASMLADLRRLLAVRPRDVAARVSMLGVADQFDVEGQELLRELIEFFAEQRDWGMAVTAAEQLVASVPAPALPERTLFVEMLGHSGQALAELQQGRELVGELLRSQQRDEAIVLLERLLEHHEGQVELRRQLAELLVFADRGHEAVRHFRACIPLLQEAGDIEEAGDVLLHLRDVQGENPEIDRAESLLAEGVPINWQSIRDELTAIQSEKLEQAGEASHSRRTAANDEALDDLEDHDDS